MVCSTECCLWYLCRGVLPVASLGLGLAPLANKRGITAGFLLACIYNIFMRAMLLLAAPVRHIGNGVYYALK